SSATLVNQKAASSREPDRHRLLGLCPPGEVTTVAISQFLAAGREPVGKCEAVRIFREIRRVGVNPFTLITDAPGDHGGDRGRLDPSRVVGRTLGNIKEEGRTMRGLLKSTALGAVLLTGMVLAAQAQSVSASPPAGGAPQQSVKPHPFGPKPSGSHT